MMRNVGHYGGIQHNANVYLARMRYYCMLESFEKMFVEVSMVKNYNDRELMLAVRDTLSRKGFGSVIPKGEKSSAKSCPLAKALGVPANVTTIADSSIFDTHEKVVLAEFIKRFDAGRYPEYEGKDVEDAPSMTIELGDSLEFGKNTVTIKHGNAEISVQPLANTQDALFISVTHGELASMFLPDERGRIRPPLSVRA